MPLKNGDPMLANARRERAEEAWRSILRKINERASDDNWERDAITEIEQAMDDMADYVVGSALA